MIQLSKLRKQSCLIRNSPLLPSPICITSWLLPLNKATVTVCVCYSQLGTSLISLYGSSVDVHACTLVLNYISPHIHVYMLQCCIRTISFYKQLPFPEGMMYTNRKIKHAVVSILERGCTSADVLDSVVSLSSISWISWWCCGTEDNTTRAVGIYSNLWNWGSTTRCGCILVSE